jgi:hypothetical protein
VTDIDEPEPRKVVEGTSDLELARQFSADRLSRAIRELTANLLRVMRGAGRSYAIGDQLQSIVRAFIEYQEKFGYLPAPFMFDEMLSIDQSEAWRTHLRGAELMRSHAEARIVRGALQVAASLLLRQLTHQRAGERELRDGIQDLDAAREETRREVAAERIERHKLSSNSPRRLRR